MKKLIYFLLPLLVFCVNANAEDVLTGEKRAACEATLCLSASSGRPQECKDSLKRYFKIKVKKSFGIDPRKTLEARKNFLKLCPKKEGTDQATNDAMINKVAENNMQDVSVNQTPCQEFAYGYNQYHCQAYYQQQEAQRQAEFNQSLDNSFGDPVVRKYPQGQVPWDDIPKDAITFWQKDENGQMVFVVYEKQDGDSPCLNKSGQEMLTCMGGSGNTSYWNDDWPVECKTANFQSCMEENGYF